MGGGHFRFVSPQSLEEAFVLTSLETWVPGGAWGRGSEWGPVPTGGCSSGACQQLAISPVSPMARPGSLHGRGLRGIHGVFRQGQSPPLPCEMLPQSISSLWLLPSQGDRAPTLSRPVVSWWANCDLEAETRDGLSRDPTPSAWGTLPSSSAASPSVSAGQARLLAGTGGFNLKSGVWRP